MPALTTNWGDFVPHQVAELPPVHAWVTEHRLHRMGCSVCGRTTRATLPPAVPAGAFGPRLQTTVALLSRRYRLSRREVVDVCGTLLDAPPCVGSVDGLCQAPQRAFDSGELAQAGALSRFRGDQRPAGAFAAPQQLP